MERESQRADGERGNNAGVVTGDVGTCWEENADREPAVGEGRGENMECGLPRLWPLFESPELATIRVISSKNRNRTTVSQ